MGALIPHKQDLEHLEGGGSCTPRDWAEPLEQRKWIYRLVNPLVIQSMLTK